MTDIRISDVVAKTGFGARYWQRRVAAGEVPGARFVQAGARRIFVLDEAQFSAWWEKQKCPVTSGGAGPMPPDQYASPCASASSSGCAFASLPSLPSSFCRLIFVSGNYYAIALQRLVERLRCRAAIATVRLIERIGHMPLITEANGAV